MLEFAEESRLSLKLLLKGPMEILECVKRHLGLRETSRSPASYVINFQCAADISWGRIQKRRFQCWTANIRDSCQGAFQVRSFPRSTMKYNAGNPVGFKNSL